MPVVCNAACCLPHRPVQVTVSLHIYAPAFATCRIFDEASARTRALTHARHALTHARTGLEPMRPSGVHARLFALLH
jgi:hypothetical protein